MSLDDYKKNAKEYFKNFQNMDDQAKKNLIGFLIAGALMIAPVGIMVHYNHKASAVSQIVQNNNNEAKNLINKASAKEKYAKVQLDNQPQTQRKVEQQVQKIIKAQKVLFNPDSSQNELRETQAFMVDASDGDILNNPDKALAPFSAMKTRALEIKASYSPTYSVYQKSIHVVLEFSYHNQPVFYTDCLMNVKNQKLTNLIGYTTKWTDYYSYNPKSIDDELRYENAKTKKEKAAAKKALKESKTHRAKSEKPKKKTAKKDQKKPDKKKKAGKKAKK